MGLERRADTLERIYRRWPLHYWNSEGHRRWQHGSPTDQGLWLGGFFLIITLSLELALRLEKVVFIPVTWWMDSLVWRVFLLLLFLVNTWILEDFLNHRTPPGLAIKPWMIVARRLVLILPILRLWSLPLWHKLLQSTPREPTWKLPDFLHPSPSHCARALRSMRYRFPATLRSSPALMARPEALFLFLGSEITTALHLFVVVTTLRSDAEYHSLLWGVTHFFHLLTAGCIAVYSHHRLREPALGPARRILLVLFPLSFLLPFPTPLLGIVLWLMLDLLDQRHGQLIRSAFDRRSSVRSLASWAGMEEHLQREGRIGWWTRLLKPLGPNRPLEAGEIERKFTSLCRAKTLLVFFDALPLAWPLSTLATQGDPPAELLWIAVVASVLGVLLALTTVWTKSLRRAIPPATGLYLAGGSFLFLTGWTSGVWWAQGKTAMLGQVMLFLSSIVFLLLSLLYSVTATVKGTARSSDDVMSLYLLLAIAFTGLGLYLFLDPVGAHDLLAQLGHVLGLGPIGGVALALSSRRWLVHPFHRLGILGFRQRIALRFMVLTSLLPLGGLAVPAWIVIRHWWWANWQEEVFSRHSMLGTPSGAWDAGESRAG